MAKVHTLQGINFFLSLCVIFLSIAILEYFYGVPLNASNKPSFYTEAIPELYVTEEASLAGKATAWLEAEAMGAGEYEISIRLETQQPIHLADLTITFDPVSLRITDALPEVPGIQVSYGEADVYLENEVDSEKGVVTLAGRFEKQQKGKLLLGKLRVSKLLPQKTEIQIQFTPNSLQDSFVKGFENEENILAVEPGITL